MEHQLSGETPGPVGNSDPGGGRWSLIQDPETETWTGARGSRNGAGPERPSTGKILETLRHRGVEVAPILTPAQVAADENYLSRGFIQSVDHPLEAIGTLQVTSVPWRLEGTVPEVSAVAPCIGSANPEVLGRYVSEDQLAELENEGALK
ncbi:CoA transferase [Citricoccus parietis]|uniref:CoA transferase n=1 Tax=Citricoccus parietis TaxID=592307 RepID=A0ABV5G393_9MICC